MNTLSILVTPHRNIKQLSLGNITMLRNNLSIEEETSVGLAAFLTGLSENNLDRMITT